MSIGFIGGGVGALTAALLLSKQGKQVTIYEQRDSLGGRLAFQEGNGYRIDQGPTIVLLPELLLEILEEGGISRDRLPLLPCDPLYRLHYADGTVFHKWSSLPHQLAELSRVFPGSEEGYTRYLADMFTSYQLGKSAFLDKPFLQKREFFTWRNLNSLRKMRAYKSVRGLTKRYFAEEKLQDAFSLQTLYIGGAPFASPALYSLIPFAEHAFGIWYVKGGYASLVSLLREELESRGVEIHLQTSIEQLVVEHGECRGVVSEGQTYLHDAVVFNGDFPHLSSLLPKEITPLTKQKKSYQPSSGCVLVYLGVNKRWSEATTHQFFLPESLNASLEEMFAKSQMPSDPSFYVFNPTAIDPEAAPAGQSVLYLLIPVPAANSPIDWEHETPKLVDHVLAEAERRGFDGLQENIRWIDVRTPHQAKLEGLYEGGSFGIAPTLLQSGVFRPQIVPPYPINRLYAVGASIHPGGGIPIVMQGARLLTQHLTTKEPNPV